MTNEAHYKKLYQIAVYQIEKQVLIWNRDIEECLTLYFNLLVQHRSAIEKLLAKKSLPEMSWHLLENYLINVVNWVQNIGEIPNWTLKGGFWTAWQIEIGNLLKNLPEKTTIQIEDELYKNEHRQKYKIKIWHQFYRWRKLAKRTLYRILNKFRSLMKKTPLNYPDDSRTIFRNNFLTRYVGIPVAQFMLDEWQIFLQHVSKHLYFLHQKNEEFKDELLDFSDSFQLRHDISEKEISAYIAKIDSVLQSGKAFLKLIKNFSDLSQQRLIPRWENMIAAAEEKWKFAGTALLPNKKFNHNKINRNWLDLEKRLSDFKSHWLIHFQGEEGEWQKDLELSLLQLKSAILCNEHIKIICNKIQKRFIPHLTRAQKKVDESKNVFSDVKVTRKSDLTRKISQTNKNLQKLLRGNVLPQIVDQVVKSNIEKDFQNYILKIEEYINQLSEEHRIYKSRSVEFLPPESQTDLIPLKHLVYDEFFPGIRSTHLIQQENLHGQLELFIRNTSEMDQIVEYNLDAALNLLEMESQRKISEEGLQIVNEGLNRAHEQLSDLINLCKNLCITTDTDIKALTYDFESKIQELTDNEKILALKIRLARARAKEELRANWHRLATRISRFLPLFIRQIRKWTRRSYEKVIKFQKLTGLTQQTIDIGDELSQFLTKTEIRIRALPYIYQRLFRSEPLEDERFFTGRTKEIVMMENQVNLWENGHYAVTVIVGEKGSGKTTLLNFAEKNLLNDYEILKFSADRTITKESDLLNELTKVFKIKNSVDFTSLEKMILDQDKRKIFILENIHNIFLKTVDGFATLERLMLFMSRTHSKILWLTSCTLYSWQYLEQTIKLSKYYTKIIHLSELSREEVRHIILKRHRVSGYKLAYTVPKEIAKSKKFRRLSTEEKRQEFLQEIFFDELVDLSRGNISITILFWLRAIQEISQDKIIANPLINFDFSFLHHLTSDELFALVVFIQHERLPADLVARILRQDDVKTAMLLERMSNRGILIQESQGFQVHPFLYRAVIRTLKSKNILH